MSNAEFEYFVTSAIAAIVFAASKSDNVVTLYNVGYHEDLDEVVYEVRNAAGEYLADNEDNKNQFNMVMLNAAMSKLEGVTTIAA